MTCTNADEYGASATSDAPDTPIVVTISVAVSGAASGASLSETVKHGC